MQYYKLYNFHKNIDKILEYKLYIIIQLVAFLITDKLELA